MQAARADDLPEFSHVTVGLHSPLVGDPCFSMTVAPSFSMQYEYENRLQYIISARHRDMLQATQYLYVQAQIRSRLLDSCLAFCFER